jgi:hypothetical protein
LTLLVSGTTVQNDASTEVKRRGDVQTLDALKVNQEAHVGTRRSDGSLDARKIEINDEPAGNEFEIEGALGGLSGTCPERDVRVNGLRRRDERVDRVPDGGAPLSRAAIKSW